MPKDPSSAINALLAELAKVPPTDTLANPYATERPDLDRNGGAAIRRRNCEMYLQKLARRGVKLIILGEAAGYQGCRFSGIAFTSEYTLANHPFFKEGGFERSGIRERLFREPSGSIVWETIEQLPHTPVLWNIVPFHPHKPDAPLSNRTPTRAERELGAHFLLQLLEILGNPAIAAAGRLSADSLQQLGIKHTAVRHPAYGGKAEFQQGIAAFHRATPHKLSIS
jgi:hypothetical protein